MAVLRIAFPSSAVLDFRRASASPWSRSGSASTSSAPLGFGARGPGARRWRRVFVLLPRPPSSSLRELAAVWHDRAAGEAAIAALESLGRDAAALPAGVTPPAPTAAPAVGVRRLRYRHPGQAEDAVGPLDLDIGAARPWR